MTIEGTTGWPAQGYVNASTESEGLQPPIDLQMLLTLFRKRMLFSTPSPDRESGSGLGLLSQQGARRAKVLEVFPFPHSPPFRPLPPPLPLPPVSPHIVSAHYFGMHMKSGTKGFGVGLKYLNLKR